eukprot:240743-Rhodomonas_salina.1
MILLARRAGAEISDHDLVQDLLRISLLKINLRSTGLLDGLIRAEHWSASLVRLDLCGNDITKLGMRVQACLGSARRWPILIWVATGFVRREWGGLQTCCASGSARRWPI